MLFIYSAHVVPLTILHVAGMPAERRRWQRSAREVSSRHQELSNLASVAAG